MTHVAYAFAATYVAQLSPLLQARVTCGPGAATAMLEEHERQLAALEAQLGDAAYMGGDAPSLADISFFASAQYYGLFYQFPLAQRFVRLQAVYKRFSQRPSAIPPYYPSALASIAPICKPHDGH